MTNRPLTKAELPARRIFFFLPALLAIQLAFAQDCKTNSDLDAMPGKYLTAAEYPFPAARAGYFSKMTAATDKTLAKQILGQLEKTEAKSHTGFTLTGGNWENVYSTEGYGYAGNTRLGKYTFQSALYEYFCNKGKPVRSSEYSTVLRIYVNSIPVNTLDRFMQNPFGSSLGEYDFGLQFSDWKNHKPADVNAQLISLFTYFSCNNAELLAAINTGEGYFQDVPEKDIKPNNRSNFIYRYWFVKKKDISLLLPVSRKEYLQSLLEYYEREKLYFPRLVSKLTQDHNNGVKQYSSWERDVADKIAVVKKILSENNDEWLSAPAVINRIEDAALTYKAGMKERTNYNRFWQFYSNEKKSQPLYKINPDYFVSNKAGAATPQLMTVAFRYVNIPVARRLLDNFSEQFDFSELQRLLK